MIWWLLSLATLWMIGVTVVASVTLTGWLSGARPWGGHSNWSATLTRLLLEGALFASSTLFWVVLLALSGWWRGLPAGLSPILAIVAGAQLPLLAYPCTAVPVIGRRLEQFLPFWVLLLVISGLWLALGWPLSAAISAAIPGWILLWGIVEARCWTARVVC